MTTSAAMPSIRFRFILTSSLGVEDLTDDRQEKADDHDRHDGEDEAENDVLCSVHDSSFGVTIWPVERNFLSMCSTADCQQPYLKTQFEKCTLTMA